MATSAEAEETAKDDEFSISGTKLDPDSYREPENSDDLAGNRRTV